MAWKLIWTEDDAGVADGLATLDGAAKVVQDPANALPAPAPNAIVKAEPTGKISTAWLKTDTANGVAGLDGSKQVVCDGVSVNGVKVVGAQSGPIPDPMGGMTIDNECRAAVLQMLAALRGHGLIEP